MSTKTTDLLTAATVIAFLLALFLIASGCGSQAVDRSTMIKDFGTAEVIPFPDRCDTYVIRDTNGAIWAANCSGSKPVYSKLLEANR